MDEKFVINAGSAQWCENLEQKNLGYCMKQISVVGRCSGSRIRTVGCWALGFGST